MTRRKSEPRLSLLSDRSTLPQDSAAYMLFLEAQVAKNLTTPQQLHALDERMAALAAAQKAVAGRCGELDGKISGSVRLAKIAQAFAEQVTAPPPPSPLLRCSQPAHAQVETDAKSASATCMARISDTQQAVSAAQVEHAKLAKHVSAASASLAQLQEQAAAAASAGAFR